MSKLPGQMTQEHYLECQCDIVGVDDVRCNSYATRSVWDTKLTEFLNCCEGHYQSLYEGTNAIATDIKQPS